MLPIQSVLYEMLPIQNVTIRKWTIQNVTESPPAPLILLLNIENLFNVHSLTWHIHEDHSIDLPLLLTVHVEHQLNQVESVYLEHHLNQQSVHFVHKLYHFLFNPKIKVYGFVLWNNLSSFKKIFLFNIN